MLWVCAALCGFAWWGTTLRGPVPKRQFGGSVLCIIVYKMPDGRYGFQDPYIGKDPRPTKSDAIGAMYLFEENLRGPPLWRWGVFRFHGMWTDYRYQLLTQLQSLSDTLDSSDPELKAQSEVWLGGRASLGEASIAAPRIAAARKLPSDRQSGPIASAPPQWLWMTEPIRLWYPRQVLRNAGEILWLPLLCACVACLVLPTKKERAQRRRARGECPHCHYDLKSQFDRVCPECGKNPKRD
jgi:hypothetical protein